MKAWPKVALADIAPIVRRPVEIRHDQAYPELGIRSFSKGTFHKPPLSGSEVGTKRLFQIEPGDLVFSNVFAWEGAIAVASPADAGRFGSHRFITCVADSDRANATYLKLYLTASPEGRAQVLQASPGGAGRNRTLGIEKLGQIRVPLPPLAEQQAIVARLDALVERTREVEAHLDAVERDAERLVRAYIFHPPGEQPIKRPVSELVQQRAPDVSVDRTAQYRFAGVYSFGRGVFPSAVKTGSEFAYKRLSTVRAGDFTYPKLMAWEGALGVVPAACDGMVVSPEFPVFGVNTDKVLPEVLDIYFRTPEVWPALAELSGGTNVRRRRLQPSAFLRYEIPVPFRAVQLKIRELFRCTQAFKARHAEIRLANAALIPATLERIFSEGR
ncbi:MAG: restriction endonuclease subunit S [Piscinibacter sp.]|uniref:restriction endonuclease subunit S n=1 Tax=Piscinibacter sp. TaxID=1903157 RepID=UPI001B632E9D|nr:restriction endonuclease subunit S [Piscinibacter sp.]MBP5988643.1 restriction endonuclease subunit S [Piscinibacter sp.]MBP6025868.1 restriction endonuclease subunit S [Piscinibacter sp.]